MHFFKNKNNGTTLVEFAFILPMLVTIIFGILEAYRLKVAEKLTENVAMHVATEFAFSETISANRIRQIIKNCHDEGDMLLFDNNAIDDNLLCSISVYSKHDDAKNSNITTWPNEQGVITLSIQDKNLKGCTVVAYAFLKYKFLTTLTKAVFTGSSNGDFIIRKKKFTKCN